MNKPAATQVVLTPALTVAETAEYLGVSNKTVYRLINRGQLPAYYLGNSSLLRIHLSDIDALFRPVLAGPRSVG